MTTMLEVDAGLANDATATQALNRLVSRFGVKAVAETIGASDRSVYRWQKEGGMDYPTQYIINSLLEQETRKK